MKVAIDTGTLKSGHAVRGIGVHTRELTEELAKSRDKELEIEMFDFAMNKERLASGHYDIVHYPYFHPFFLTLPFNKPAGKVVVTIHDLIQLIYPEHYPPGVKGEIRFTIQKFLLRNVDAIITISETSKKDICRFLGVNPSRVHVIYLAPKKVFRKLENGKWELEVKKRYGLPKRFVLYVGDVNYNKNIPTLVKACKSIKFPLVIIGKQALEIEELGKDLRVLQGPMDYFRFLFDIPHPELAHYGELLREFRATKDVIRPGFVPDSDLVAIYNLASVYCQPSFYEGFGLPVLESFASETPVVSSKTQALVEIGEGGCLFADPKNPKDFAKKITNIFNDSKLANRLVSKGKGIVKNFSWQKTTKETAAVYKGVLK